jgi:hypothetical protein
MRAELTHGRKATALNPCTTRRQLLFILNRVLSDFIIKKDDDKMAMNLENFLWPGGKWLLQMKAQDSTNLARNT